MDVLGSLLGAERAGGVSERRERAEKAVAEFRESLRGPQQLRQAVRSDAEARQALGVEPFPSCVDAGRAGVRQSVPGDSTPGLLVEMSLDREEIDLGATDRAGEAVDEVREKGAAAAGGISESEDH